METEPRAIRYVTGRAISAITEGTIAWDRTHELLQMARNGVEEEETRGGHRVRGRRPSTSG